MKYSKVLNSDREKLIRAYERTGRWYEAARVLEINKSNAYKIIREFINENKRMAVKKGVKQRKMIK